MKNIKFKYDRKEPSDAEMDAAKNFEIVHSKAVPKNGNINPTRTIQTIIVVAVVALLGWYLFSTEEIQAPFVNPPMATANLEYSIYNINATNAQLLEYATGTTIEIPANSFVDKNGNPVMGDIEIRYREFHNPFEIFLSGIPMVYDSAGIQYHFESAGMFEILGFHGNEQVFINPEQQIQVKMASYNNGEYFNQYFLDTVNQNWNFIKKDNVEKFSTAIIDVPSDEEKAISDNEPAKPIKADEKYYSFEVIFNEEEFPELNVYKGLLFQVDKNEKAFSTEFARTAWE
ncbi:MAG: hypothetical protein H0X62_11000, partial [Bacteroidetes bacterium]|nr:hypothetical protein [Bacteroidota bacterium]